MDNPGLGSGQRAASGADADLDLLLQQALEEFERPVLLPSEKLQRAANRECCNEPVLSSEPCMTSGAKRKPDNSSANKNNLTDTKEIDEALSEIAKEDPSLAAQLKKLTECAAAVASEDQDVAMHNFSQFASMFKDTLTQLSAQADDGQNDASDDDFPTVMDRLNKLAMDDSCFDGSEDSDLSSLRDITNNLLSKDLLYEPLKEREGELAQWLSEKRSTLSPEVAKRHETQLSCVRSLLREYEVQCDKTDPKSQDLHLRKLLELTKQLQETGDFPAGMQTHEDLNTLYAGLGEVRDDAGKKPEFEAAPPNCATS